MGNFTIEYAGGAFSSPFRSFPGHAADVARTKGWLSHPRFVILGKRLFKLHTEF